MTTTVFTSDSHGYDTFVWQSEPDRAHNKLDYAILQMDVSWYLVYWPINQIPKDATVSSATLYTYTAGDWAGPVTVGVDLVTDSWTANQATWNNKPGNSGTTVSVTHSPTGPGTEYEHNVLALVSPKIADGSFKGLRVRRTDAGPGVRIYQRENGTNLRCRLVVVWTAVGQKPSHLSPDGIVGIPKPLLKGFPKDTQAVRVQADPSETGFSAPAWESGTTAVDAPEFDLGASDFPGATEGDSWWWRVSCQDAGDNWSDFSDPLEFTFTSLPVLTLVNPAADNPVVTDVSFPITWDVSDQKSYRAWITSTDGSGDILWDSKRVQDTDARTVTVPGKDDKGNQVLKSHATGAYRAWIRSYPSDTLDRVGMPGAMAFSQQAQVFTLISVPGVPPINSLWVTQDDQSPQVALHANDNNGTPDGLNVWMDGLLILDGIDPSTVDDDPAGGDYKIIITSAAPWTQHDLYVQRVVNGNASPPGPHAVFTPRIYGVWLTDATRNIAVNIWNDGGTFPVQTTATDQATVTWADGAPFPAVDTSAVGYKSGTIQGLIRDDVPPGNRSADSYRHQLVEIKGNPNLPLQLSYGNLSMPVLINDVDFESDGTPDISRTRVRMTMRQSGPWTIFADDTDNGGVSGPPAPDRIYRYADGGLDDGETLTVGEFDITAVAGTPTGSDDSIVPGHTDTEGWL